MRETYRWPSRVLTDSATDAGAAATGVTEAPSVGRASDVQPTDDWPLRSVDQALGFDPDARPEVPGFETQTLLGVGGMGVVFKAKQTSLNRLVALKMIRTGPNAGQEERFRFRFEAETVAKLQHPNIAQIFQVGDAEGLAYLVLEFVEGGTLAQQIAGQPQPARQSAALIEVLARAMQVAHQHGVVHRDLKPANVLLTKDGVPKIVDFGLARHISGVDPVEGAAAAGTAQYMAPEQAWGSSPIREVGPAADVYSLGAMLYELLTGRPPFRGSSSRDILQKLWTETPPSFEQLSVDVPADLAAICLKCLNKRPEDRYASAADLADDLRRFLGDEPVEARPVGTVERVQKWARRRPASALAAGVIVAAAVVILVGGAWEQYRVHRALGEAQANLVQAQDAVDELLTRLGTERLAPLPQSELVQRDVLEVALRFCQSFLSKRPDDPAVRHQAGRAQRQVAGIYQLLGRHDEATQSYGAAIDLSRQLVEEYPKTPAYRRELAVAENNRGYLLLADNKLPEAEAAFRASIAESRAATELLAKNKDAGVDAVRARRETAVGLSNLGLTLAQQGQTNAALKSHTEALAIREQLADEFPKDAAYQQDLATSQVNLGALSQTSGDAPKAREELQAAIDRLEKSPAEVASQVEHRRALATAYRNLGAVLAETDDAAAERALVKARQLLAALHADRPNTRAIRQQLAEVQLQLGMLLADRGAAQANDAEKWLTSAVDHSRALLNAGEDMASRLTLAGALHQLARLWDAQDNRVAAQQTLTEALRTAQPLVKDDSASAECAGVLAEIVHTTGAWLARGEQFGKARTFLHKATELDEHSAKAEPQNSTYRRHLAQDYRALCDVLVRLGEAGEAAQVADKLAALGVASDDDRRLAASVLARCVPLAVAIKSATPTPAGDVPLEEYCARQAVKLLGELVAQGKESRDRLATAADYAALRERADFKQLVSGK